MPEEEVIRVRRLTRWQRIGVAVLLVIGALILGSVIFVLSGVYNIAASRDHWSVTNFAITVLRDRSIATASSAIEVPPLDDPDLYRLGEQHVMGACTTCHGRPGRPLNPLYTHMTPSPPDLTGAMAHYSANEVFWIVSHGLKYTGMPAWPGSGRPDEVWSVVSYLDRLNRRPEIGANMSEEKIAAAQSFESCARCHGAEGTAPVSALVPRLEGLSEPYIARALAEYRSGIRASGFMAPVAHDMSEGEIEAFARYYSGLTVPRQDEPLPADDIAAGRQIAETGVAEDDVPACDSCHGGVNPQIPELRGQSARYLATQLKLWRNGGYRDASAQGRIMAVIGRRLGAAEAEAVSTYYAAQATDGGAP